ncbi:MAG TPA: glycosyltransferase family A protein [Candidatus Binataceae bacterium]|nr:glycosyltransferase family A protein [Candidatus Binataceae bacterium]
MPQVSVIIPVFNGAATIGRVIECVLAQSAGAAELICVDDGSTDGSADVARGYGERVRVLAQGNAGQATARNAGARVSSGEFIVFLDADDLLRPAMFERCLQALRANPQCVAAYTNAEIIGENGQVMRESMVAADRARPPSMEDLLTRIWPIVPSTAMMRRTAFAATGGFDEALRGPEDIFFWLVLRETGPFFYIPEILVAKTEYGLFPKVLERDPGARAFARAVRKRYGARARGLLGDFHRMRARLLERCAAEAIAAGEPAMAAQCYLRALAYAPRRLKNYRRLLATLIGRVRAASPTRGNR